MYLINDSSVMSGVRRKFRHQRTSCARHAAGRHQLASIQWNSTRRCSVLRVVPQQIGVSDEGRIVPPHPSPRGSYYSIKCCTSTVAPPPDRSTKH
ncbi:unnamed protein product [Danaus chrysippus]|uniref:(African queen) hypothetical protein n=1 Tax=Danaus chrysippus TaxID=151541 RepID=A0A8J2MVJ1_9NEOP|nr:unnamed protein product [Danaus chrysippus]